VIVAQRTDRSWILRLLFDATVTPRRYPVCADPVSLRASGARDSGPDL